MASETFDITAVAKLKHGDLFAAAVKVGGQSELARQLGIPPSTLGRWCNMQACPPVVWSEDLHPFWTKEIHERVERKLFELTGKTLDDLFPEELREAKEFLRSKKVISRTQTVRREALLTYAQHTRERLLTQANGERDQKELKRLLKAALSPLAYRQREVLKMRFGLDDGEAKTLDEVAEVFKVGRERVRQIEAKALRLVQQNIPACGELLEHVQEH